MKKFLMNKTVQKLYIFLTLLFLLPLWITLQMGKPVPVLAWISFGLAVICFLLDRTFKPWELERAERKRARAEQQQRELEEMSREEKK